MKATIRFFGILQEPTRCTEVDADLPEDALAEDVMAWVDAHVGPGLPLDVWKGGERRFGPLIIVFLNGEDLVDHGSSVEDGAEVVCASMLAGG